jgi:mono/diheme cytochrome c family protein
MGKTRVPMLAFASAFLTLAFLLAGCRQDMHDQPKYKPLRASDFFADGVSARTLVAGTVARGQLRENRQFYTGKTSKTALDVPNPQSESAPAARPVPSGPAGHTAPLRGYVTTFPFFVTKDLLDRGQDRFNVFCSPCHDRVGTGLGMVVRRGYRRPPSFHIDRLRQAPVGYFFDVITNGFGAMPDYASQIPPQDRWAIVAFLRALQLSQNVPISNVPPQERKNVMAGGRDQ